MLNLPPIPFPRLVDSTMMSAFDACEVKWLYEFGHHLSPLAINPDLHAGGAFSHALEATRRAYYHDNLRIDQALPLGIKALISFWGDFTPPELNPKTCEAMIGALVDYYREYPPEEDLYRPHILSTGEPAVEFTFSIPTNILHPETGEPILYGGRSDMIANYDDKWLCIMDEKTTKAFYGNWASIWGMRGQFIGYCVSNDTEVLTETGWLQIKDLTGAQKIAQWDNGMVSFTLPTQIHKPEYKGKLLSIDGKCNLVATPDHRQIVYDEYPRKYKTFDLKDIPRNSGALRFISAGLRVGGYDLPEPFTRFLVAMQADGSWQHSADIKTHGARFGFSKLRKAERLTSILEELGVEYTYSYQDGGKYSFHLPIGSELCELAYSYLGPEKVFGSIFFTLDGKSLSTFFNELRYWDGTDYGENKWMYFSTNEANVQMIQDLAPLANVHVSVHSQAGWKSTKRHYRVVITKKVHHSVHLHTWGEVDYEGSVYCVTVPSSYFLTRRDKKVMVTGNCFAGQYYGYPITSTVIRGIAILKTKYHHLQVIEEYSQWQIDRWWETTNNKIAKMVQAWKDNAWTHSYGDACGSYGGCTFLPLCTTHQPEDGFSNYQRRVWDPLAKNPTWPKGGPKYETLGTLKELIR